MTNCLVCGKPYAEKHHVVFKGQGGLDADFNIISLCPEHHRGNSGPHRNRNTDYRYKQNVQIWLYNHLPESVRVKPDFLTVRQWDKLIKNLPYNGEGYNGDDVIRKLMGGRLYV